MHLVAKIILPSFPLIFRPFAFLTARVEEGEIRSKYLCSTFSLNKPLTKNLNVCGTPHNFATIFFWLFNM